MLYRFKARDLFDKLLRLGDRNRWGADGAAYRDVVSVVDPSQLFGDREKSAQLPPGLFWVDADAVEEVEEKVREFSSVSELGGVRGETQRVVRLHSGPTLRVCLLEFEHGCSVTVSEDIGGSYRTRYARVYYGEPPFDDIVTEAGKIDDQIIFRLDSLRRD